MRWEEPRAGVPLSASSAVTSAATEAVLRPLGQPFSRASLATVSRRVRVAWRPATRAATQTAPPEGEAVAMLVVLWARRSSRSIRVSEESLQPRNRWCLAAVLHHH